MNKKIVNVNQLRDGSSVIQSNPQKLPFGMAIQDGKHEHFSIDDPEKQCRELLARRPSYRKLLKELSSSDPDIKSRLVRDSEDNANNVLPQNPLASNTSTNHHRDIVNAVHTITQHAHKGDDTNGSEVSGTEDDSDSQGQRRLDDETDHVGSSNSSTGASNQQVSLHNHPGPHFTGGYSGLQMPNMGSSEDADRAYHLAINSSAAQSGPNIQQHPAHSHLAAIIPQSSGYQLAPGVIMSGSSGNTPASISAAMAVMGHSTSPPIGEEVARKREMRLLKNREAARECRRKKKEYVKCLENRVAVLEAQNKTLIDELKALKELYCQHNVGPGPND